MLSIPRPHLSVLFSLAVFIHPTAIGQKSTARPVASAATQTRKSDVKDSAKEGQVATGITNAVLKQPDDRADYIPCKFTYNELTSLVMPERRPTLTPADAEKLVQSVVGELERQQDSKALDAATVQTLIGSFNWTQFAGLTPTQAIAKILRGVQVARNAANIQRLAVDAYAQARIATDKSKSAEIRKTASDNIQAMLTEAESANIQMESMGKGDNDPWMSNFQFLVGQALEKIRAASKDAANRTDEALSEQKYSYYSNYFGQKTTESSTASSGAEQVTAAASQIVNTAQSSVKRLMRPDDIGCAMSILSWEETHRAYGRIIANTYIAVQVVVRNLSREQQFILHDVEFAANVDPSGRIGRFYSGRDKVVVRALSQSQQLFDSRNLAVGGAEAINAIMAASALVYGGALNDAAHVFSSGFLPGFSKVWADTSKDQSNLLNDTAFTSRSNAQIVVPTTGSAMFVTFIPQKQFQEGWWTRACASRIFFPDITKRDAREMIALTGQDRVAGDESVGATGIDIQHALSACRIEEGPPNTGTPGISETSSGPVQGMKQRRTSVRALQIPAATEGGPSVPISQEPGQQSANIDGIAVSAERHPFHKWSGNALAIFQELSTAVVAGIHIIDERQLQPTLTDLKCDSDKDSGKLNWPTDSSGDVVCTLTGKNLNKIKSLQLHNADDAADPNFADGTLKLDGGDSSSAVVSFKGESLHDLPGTNYSIQFIDDKDVPLTSGLMVHLRSGPFINNLQPNPIDANSPPDVIDLLGYKLDKVQKMTLSTTSGVITLTLASAPVSDARNRHFSASSTDWTKLGRVKGDAMIQLLSSDGVVLESNTKTVTFIPKSAPTSSPTQKSAGTKKTKGSKS